jgi:tetratricopeptide (TPR) repeat protein
MSVANLYEGKTHDAEAAFIVWLTVFRREPTRPHLIEQLDRLARSVADCSELVGETQKLADELAPEHPTVAAALWQEIATWLRDRLGNREEAVRAFGRAAQLDPSIAARDEAAELLRNDGRWPELIELLARRADGETDARRRCEIFEEIATVYEDQLGQPGEAVAWFERATNADPESGSALVALHRLYLEGQAWDALSELLPRLIEVIGPSTPRSVIVAAACVALCANAAGARASVKATAMRMDRMNPPGVIVISVNLGSFPRLPRGVTRPARDRH